MNPNVKLIILSVVSCFLISPNITLAAKKSKYTITSFTKQGNTYEYYKTKKNLFGMKKAKDDKWILKPKYKEIYFISDVMVMTRTKSNKKKPTNSLI